MTGKAIEAFVVVLCLPFYAIAWPVMTWHDVKKAKILAQRECPHCHKLMSGLCRGDIQMMGIRLKITAGTTVDWERLPRTKLRCPHCGEHSCVDSKLRFTSCNQSDFIHRREVEHG